MEQQYATLDLVLWLVGAQNGLWLLMLGWIITALRGKASKETADKAEQHMERIADKVSEMSDAVVRMETIMEEREKQEKRERA